jgi:beta-lactamase regulating signal transducer with metallopeptidase domain
VERIVAPATPMTLEPATAFVASATVSDPLALSDWPQILVILWLAGAAAMLVRGLLVYRAQRRTILANGVRIAGIGTIRIVRSSAVRGPMAFGLIDRVIVVPIDFDQKFSERQRSLALAHELAHHRSGDLVANSIAFVLLCLQWFNPLAWAAHAAFRFDQEAACDARVLDKADARDRASYGEAIAKAATRRSLLFAGALDQPSTLSRRLKIMTESTRSKGRTTGLLLVGGALLLALPLTATSAVRYVDVAAPEPVAAPVPVALPASVVAPAPVAPSLPAPAVRAVKLAALAPAAAAAPRVPGVILKDSDLSISGDSVWIDGKRKRWEELTPEERARVRAATAQARKTINEQIANLPKQLAEIERSRDMFRSGDFQRQMIDAREGVQRALAEMDAQAKILRATGQDPDKLKRDLQKSLEQIQQTNVEKITRESLESLDPEKIRSQIMSARTSLDEIEARLNQLERR